MDKNSKIHGNFCNIAFVVIFVFFLFLLLDFNLHNPYGLSSDTQYHQVIVNYIDNIKNIPVVEPQTGIDKPEYPPGFHVWIVAILQITGLDGDYVVSNSNFLMASILLFLIYIFFKKISSKEIAIITLIILVFSGGIGWLFYPKILSTDYISVFSQYMSKTGLFDGNIFSTKLLASSTQPIGLCLIFLFLFLLFQKRYILSSIVFTSLSFIHRNSFVFLLFFFIFYLIKVKEFKKTILIIPIILLCSSFFWNFFPSFEIESMGFLGLFFSTEFIIRVILLVSCIIFLLKPKVTGVYFTLGFYLILLSLVLDVFLNFNSLTSTSSVTVYKQFFFLYGPLLISLIFIKLVNNEKWTIVYSLLFTSALLSQTNAIFEIINPGRLLVFALIPLAFIYSILLINSEKKYKILFFVLLLLLLIGNFADLNRYTRNDPDIRSINTYADALTFIRENLPMGARIITSPLFDRNGKRNSIIIPAMTGKFIYNTYVFSYEQFMTEKLDFSNVPRFSNQTIIKMLNNNDFLFDTDILSRRLQVAYFFKNPTMNISKTKLKEMNSHLLTSAIECSLFKENYELLYSDDKVCLFKI